MKRISMSIPQDVLIHNVLPYISLEDLVKSKDKDPTLEHEYQRRIEDILENATHDEILAAGLVTQDSRLLGKFFQGVIQRDEVGEIIHIAIQDSLTVGNFDLVVAADKYDIPHLEEYVPLSILLAREYEDFVDKYPNVPNLEEEEFRIYLRELYPSREYVPKFRDIYDHALYKVIIHNPDIVWNALIMLTNKKRIPVDFLIKKETLDEHQMVKVLKMLKSINSDRYDDYLQDVLGRYPYFINLETILERKEEAKSLYELLKLAHNFE